MGCLCIAAAPDLRAELRLMGCCIPAVTELQRTLCSVLGKSSVTPIAAAVEGEAGLRVLGATGCSQRAPCLQALPLLGFHFQKVGRKPELTLMWEPEKPEQESVSQVRPRSTGQTRKTMGQAWKLCATHGPRDLHMDGSGRHDCPVGNQVLLSLCVPIPVSPASASISSPSRACIQPPPPHRCPHV